jgi:hypothetical protein
MPKCFDNNNTYFMKKIINVIILFFLCNTAFCQDPPDFGDPNDDNPTDQAAPIDDQLPIIVITAVFFGIYVIARKRQSV